MSDACPGTAARLAEHDYRAIVVTLDQFTQCGGGVHCLTMPLSREV
jgi:arginine deiminase